MVTPCQWPPPSDDCVHFSLVLFCLQHMTRSANDSLMTFESDPVHSIFGLPKVALLFEVEKAEQLPHRDHCRSLSSQKDLIQL